jgi:hypothetical protein
MDDTLLKTIATFGGLVTITVGIIQYGVTKRSEFRRRFWEEQLGMYRRVCAAASTLATSKDLKEAEPDRLEFWKLFWGELSILEHGNVKKSMEDFGAALRKVEDGNASPNSLEQPSYRLARACRKSLGLTWDPVGLDDLA